MALFHSAHHVSVVYVHCNKNETGEERSSTFMHELGNEREICVWWDFTFFSVVHHYVLITYFSPFPKDLEKEFYLTELQYPGSYNQNNFEYTSQ